jgi:hypothetical protein
MLCTLAPALPAVCVQCTIWLFSVISSVRAFPECVSGIFLIIFRWFRLPPLLLVSLLFPYSVIAYYFSPAVYRLMQWIISIVMTKSTQLGPYYGLFCVSSPSRLANVGWITNTSLIQDMIWYMIWCDTIRYMIWYDIWYDMMWYDVMWYDMIWYDTIYDTIRYMIWYDMIYDMMWYDVMWCDAIWCDIIWYDMIWYDMLYDMIYMIWYDIWYDIFVNCNWVATRWQQYSTHLHTNSTAAVQYTVTHKQYSSSTVHIYTQTVQQ